MTHLLIYMLYRIYNVEMQNIVDDKLALWGGGVSEFRMDVGPRGSEW